MSSADGVYLTPEEIERATKELDAADQVMHYLPDVALTLIRIRKTLTSLEMTDKMERLVGVLLDDAVRNLQAAHSSYVEAGNWVAFERERLAEGVTLEGN